MLPTSGAARLRGGLSAADFVKVISVQELERRGAQDGSTPAITTLARAEGLEAHARSRRGAHPWLRTSRPRDAVLRMAPYSPAHSAAARARLRLDFNENTVGCSPRVIALPPREAHRRAS